jgi:hypothetical protein
MAVRLSSLTDSNQQAEVFRLEGFLATARNEIAEHEISHTALDFNEFFCSEQQRMEDSELLGFWTLSIVWNSK